VPKQRRGEWQVRRCCRHPGCHVLITRRRRLTGLDTWQPCRAGPVAAASGGPCSADGGRAAGWPTATSRGVLRHRPGCAPVAVGNPGSRRRLGRTRCGPDRQADGWVDHDHGCELALEAPQRLSSDGRLVPAPARRPARIYRCGAAPRAADFEASAVAAIAAVPVATREVIDDAGRTPGAGASSGGSGSLTMVRVHAGGRRGDEGRREREAAVGPLLITMRRRDGRSRHGYPTSRPARRATRAAHSASSGFATADASGGLVGRHHADLVGDRHARR